jgi:hypothetical protein
MYIYKYINISYHSGDLEVVEIMQIIDWIEYFTVQMETFGYYEKDLKCLRKFTDISEDLLSEYLVRIKTQVFIFYFYLILLIYLCIPTTSALLSTYGLTYFFLYPTLSD